MALDDVKKIVVITKSRLFEWNVMLFNLKNATNTFLWTMVNIFKDYTSQFLKVFVDNVNIHLNRKKVNYFSWYYGGLEYICMKKKCHGILKVQIYSKNIEMILNFQEIYSSYFTCDFTWFKPFKKFDILHVINRVFFTVLVISMW
jgi:hypothetical protein